MLSFKIEMSDIEIKHIFEIRNIYIFIVRLKYFMSWIKFDNIFTFIYRKTLNVKEKKIISFIKWNYLKLYVIESYTKYNVLLLAKYN